MNFQQIFTIWKKELKDTIRDKRTLFSMVLIPIVMMPLLMIGMAKLTEIQFKEQQEQVARIAVRGGEYAPAIMATIKNDPNLLIIEENGDFKEAVAEERLEGGLIIPQDFEEKIKNEEASPLTIITKSTNLKSTALGGRITSLITAYNAQITQRRFQDKGINPGVLSGAVLETQDAASKQEASGMLWGMILPMIIVIWAITGGQYTAIDVSAGEKERKTLEALLMTPIKRLDLVIGKFLAVSTVALVSTILALGSMYISISQVMGGTMKNLAVTSGAAPESATQASMFSWQISVEPQAFLILLAVSILLVLMFSAILLSISIYAKNFKEAGNYISPAYMLIIIPIVALNSMPDFVPALWHFALPAVGAMLLFKEVLMGTYDAAHLAITITFLIIYAILVLLIATKIYAKESVIFNS